VISKQICFGVGCFNFGPTIKTPAKYSGQQYINDLRSTIEQIPSISKIFITEDNDFINETFEFEDSIPKISEDFGFFPSPGGSFDCEFNVYIPTRLHKELMPDAMVLSCENFHIHIKDLYYFFVTIIYPLGDIDNNEPSDAVPLVREFLEKEFSRINEKKVRFECLGPSPFHANFFVAPAVDENIIKLGKDGFFCENENLPGYNKITIFYDSLNITTDTELRDRIWQVLSDELAIYYFTTLIRNTHVDKWSKLEQMIQDLIAIENIPLHKRTVKQVLTGGSRIKQAILSITNFESELIWDKFEVDQNQKRMTVSRENPIIKAQFDALDFECPKYPVDQLKSIVSFLEKKHTKLSDNFVVLVSAILGGAVGALLTLMFAK
jgi:hypothetical protein